MLLGLKKSKNCKVTPLTIRQGRVRTAVVHEKSIHRELSLLYPNFIFVIFILRNFEVSRGHFFKKLRGLNNAEVV